MSINVVYKKTNGQLHDIQWKEEKDMDDDDFILTGFDHVPDMEEVKLLHDSEYIEAQAAEKEIQDEVARLKEQENQTYRAQAVANIASAKAILEEGK
jgi:hypothetical protein